MLRLLSPQQHWVISSLRIDVGRGCVGNWNWTVGGNVQEVVTRQGGKRISRILQLVLWRHAAKA